MIHSLITLQVGVCLAGMNTETESELTYKSYSVAYNIPFFACHIQSSMNTPYDDAVFEQMKKDFENIADRFSV